MKAPLSLILAATLGGATLAHAQEPEDFIKYREAMMKAMAGHSGAMSQIVRGKVSPEGHLQMHAKSLAELSSDIASLFPEGSDFGETEAKEEIWKEWDKFQQAADNAKQATATLAATVDSGDEAKIAAAFKDVGQACKGCHEDFRKEEEH